MDAPTDLYIDGTWRPAADGARTPVLDPATEQVLTTVAMATPGDVDDALAAAAAGFRVWRATGAWQRSDVLRRMAGIVRDEADRYAEVMTGEQGKPLAQARAEVLSSADQFDWYADEARRIYGRTVDGHSPDMRITVRREPIGPVAAFAPWNFPSLLPARKIAPALAAGCSVVSVPPIEAPLSSLLFAEAAQRAGLPPGVLNIITGDPPALSEHLVTSPVIRKVSLTGSVPVGIAVNTLAARTLKSVSMELGGHAPVLVFPDADIDAAARAAALGKFRNAGQVCISASRFLVHESVVDQFTAAFVEQTRQLRLGPGRDPATDMGPLGSAKRREAVEAMVADAVGKGARVAHGGVRPEEFQSGFFFAPTVLTGVTGDMAVMTEEPFGPIAPITAFAGFDEAIAVANSTAFGLAGFVYTRDLDTAYRASEALETGMVGVNHLTIATAEAPFGGVKYSGFGREGGTEGIADYTHAKYVNMLLPGRRHDLAGVDRGLTAYGDEGFSRFLRRAFLASAGFDEQDLDRPVVGIADTSSDYTTCHRQMPELVRAVERGVLEAGGLPLVFGSMSLPEILLNPTSMLFRNLDAMVTEELLRAQPMDAAVLVGGCDKTVPAQVMAAVSADVPAVSLVAGPMLTSSFQGQRLGACTDCRSMWARHRAGELDGPQIAGVRSALATTAGTCMVMGTASTMACIVEAMGLALPGSATPAATGDRLRAGVAAGRAAVALTQSRTTMRSLVTPGSVHNALVVLAAIGGSTNAVVHLLAIAHRAGVPLTLDDFAAVSREVPVITDLKPAGAGYLEDLHRAGGVPALLRVLAGFLHVDAAVVEGGSLADRLARAGDPVPGTSTIRTLADPVRPAGGLAVVRGSLAPDGAVVKVAAASPGLLTHEAAVVVFESPQDVAERIDDEDLPIGPDTILVMRNAGPVAAGMPEAGSFPIPRRLAASGVTDMVRVSDARMSGTAYGTVVLHVSPESAVGGPLALVRTGDRVRLDVPAGRLDLLVDNAELQRRRAGWVPPAHPGTGWRRLHTERVQQAHLGADLDLWEAP